MKRAALILILSIFIIFVLLWFLWSINPLWILVPCGMTFILFLVITIAFIYSAELTSFDDWDLLIRSVLYRLGFQVQPPKSLIHEHDLSNPEHWHHHHDEHEEHEK